MSPGSRRRRVRGCSSTSCPKADGLVVSRMRAAGVHRRRQDQRPRVRPRLAHVQRGLRPDAQRVRPGAHGRRLQRWRGRRAGHPMVPVADGSDYMGSLRNPAAWNNVFGFRPSRAACPNLPERDSFLGGLSTRGRWAARVLDVALLLGTQAGEDRRVPGSLSGRLDECRRSTRQRRRSDGDAGLGGARIGWLGDLGGHLPIEDGVLDVVGGGLDRLASLGCDGGAGDDPCRPRRAVGRLAGLAQPARADRARAAGSPTRRAAP